MNVLKLNRQKTIPDVINKILKRLTNIKGTIQPVSLYFEKVRVSGILTKTKIGNYVVDKMTEVHQFTPGKSFLMQYKFIRDLIGQEAMHNHLAAVWRPGCTAQSSLRVGRMIKLAESYIGTRHALARWLNDKMRSEISSAIKDYTHIIKTGAHKIATMTAGEFLSYKKHTEDKQTKTPFLDLTWEDFWKQFPLRMIEWWPIIQRFSTLALQATLRYIQVWEESFNSDNGDILYIIEDPDYIDLKVTIGLRDSCDMEEWNEKENYITISEDAQRLVARMTDAIFSTVMYKEVKDWTRKINPKSVLSLDDLLDSYYGTIGVDIAKADSLAGHACNMPNVKVRGLIILMMASGMLLTRTINELMQAAIEKYIDKKVGLKPRRTTGDDKICNNHPSEIKDITKNLNMVLHDICSEYGYSKAADKIGDKLYEILYKFKQTYIIDENKWKWINFTLGSHQVYTDDGNIGTYIGLKTFKTVTRPTGTIEVTTRQYTAEAVRPLTSPLLEQIFPDIGILFQGDIERIKEFFNDPNNLKKAMKHSEELPGSLTQALKDQIVS